VEVVAGEWACIEFTINGECWHDNILFIHAKLTSSFSAQLLHWTALLLLLFALLLGDDDVSSNCCFHDGGLQERGVYDALLNFSVSSKFCWRFFFHAELKLGKEEGTSVGTCVGSDSEKDEYKQHRMTPLTMKYYVLYGDNKESKPYS